MSTQQTQVRNLAPGDVFRHGGNGRRVVVVDACPKGEYIYVQWRALLGAGTDRERLSSNAYDNRMSPEREVEVLSQFKGSAA